MISRAVRLLHSDSSHGNSNGLTDSSGHDPATQLFRKLPLETITRVTPASELWASGLANDLPDG